MPAFRRPISLLALLVVAGCPHREVGPHHYGRCVEQGQAFRREHAWARARLDALGP